MKENSSKRCGDGGDSLFNWHVVNSRRIPPNQVRGKLYSLNNTYNHIYVDSLFNWFVIGWMIILLNAVAVEVNSMEFMVWNVDGLSYFIGQHFYFLRQVAGLIWKFMKKRATGTRPNTNTSENGSLGWGGIFKLGITW